MTILSDRRWRWAVPGLAAAAIAAGAFATTNASASEHPRLPARTAGQLLAAVQGTHVTALSGTVVQTSRLGLPELPGAAQGGDATLSPQSFAAGSRTLRVWIAGPERQRIALLGQLSESDVVHNGRDVWTYTSATRAVTHTPFPVDPAGQSP